MIALVLVALVWTMLAVLVLAACQAASIGDRALAEAPRAPRTGAPRDLRPDAPRELRQPPGGSAGERRPPLRSAARRSRRGEVRGGQRHLSPRPAGHRLARAGICGRARQR
jgi:hypothetical protein